MTTRRGLASAFNGHVQSGWINPKDADTRAVLKDKTGLTYPDPTIVTVYQRHMEIIEDPILTNVPWE